MTLKQRIKSPYVFKKDSLKIKNIHNYMYPSSKVFHAKRTQEKKTTNIYYNNYTKEATLSNGHLYYALSRPINF